MSFHHNKKRKETLISPLGQTMMDRRSNNQLRWKERNSNAVMIAVVSVCAFSGVICVWLILSSIASG